jgi:hypothetical protein
MKIEIDISDSKLENLSDSANEQLVAISKKHIEDVLDEASRLEASRNNTGNEPEITAAIINDAVEFTRKYRFSKPKTEKKVFFQAIAFIATIFTGGLFKPDEFTDKWYAILFLAVFLVAVIFNIAVYLNDSKND